MATAIFPLTVYVRRERTTDSVALQHLTSAQLETRSHRDWVFYHDAEATSSYCRIPWYYSTGPTKRNKWQTLNCYRYRLVWLPDTD